MQEVFEKILEEIEKRTFTAELYNDEEWNGQTVNNLLCLGDVTGIIGQITEFCDDAVMQQTNNKEIDKLIEVFVNCNDYVEMATSIQRLIRKCPYRLKREFLKELYINADGNKELYSLNEFEDYKRRALKEIGEVKYE